MNNGETPQISILMAVYDPRLDWLESQLKSLNVQDYPNIKLYVQDDICFSNKLSMLPKTIQSGSVQLVCSGMVIDSNGNQIPGNISKVRRCQILQIGDHLAEGLLTHNFVTGSTMLVRVETAKATVFYFLKPEKNHIKFIQKEFSI